MSGEEGLQRKMKMKRIKLLQWPTSSGVNRSKIILESAFHLLMALIGMYKLCTEINMNLKLLVWKTLHQ